MIVYYISNIWYTEEVYLKVARIFSNTNKITLSELIKNTFF